MKNNIVIIAAAFLLFIATAVQAESMQQLPASNEKEVADRIVVWAAGFCKGMEDKQGMDFAVCFKRVTDLAIERLRAEQAATPTK